MTKKDMARTIAEEMGLAVNVVQEVIQMVFDSITETLVQEGRIELRNFGVFEVKKTEGQASSQSSDGRNGHGARTLRGQVQVGDGDGRGGVSLTSYHAYHPVALRFESDFHMR